MPSHHRRSPPHTNGSPPLPPASIPAHARGSGQRHRLGRRCHRMPNPFRGPLGWQTRRRLGCAVVSVWSVELAKHPQSRHSLRAFPQVRALQPSRDRTPQAGVAGSNLASRTGCWGWSEAFPEAGIRIWTSAAAGGRPADRDRLPADHAGVGAVCACRRSGASRARVPDALVAPVRAAGMQLETARDEREVAEGLGRVAQLSARYGVPLLAQQADVVAQRE